LEACHHHKKIIGKDADLLCFKKRDSWRWEFKRVPCIALEARKEIIHMECVGRDLGWLYIV
jgi:hypothetical protein